ncbi:MAG: YfdX family protein [Thiogranum sp.]|nr:YfdX family protein [Thiogranum sp.]
MDDSGQALALGRQVYADLQQARQAALNRQAGELRAALKSARQNLTQLDLPPGLMALKAQTNIVANNLADTARSMDADLWIPIDTELDAASLYFVPENRAQARAAARAGRIAAAKGDRKMAGVQLDLLVSYLPHAMGAFPLQRVRADIQSAWSSASLPQPYWKGALEAVQSALGEVRWVASVNARPLLEAYTDTINAYVLWPQRKQTAADYLGRAQEALSELPDGAALAADAHRLMEKSNLGDDDIKQLVDDIGQRIEAERAAWREKLLDRFVTTKVG